MTNKASFIRLFVNVVIVFLLLSGVLVMFYPTVVNYIYSSKTQNIITQFQASADNLTKESDGNTLEQMREDMAAYNKELYMNGQGGLQDPFSFETTAFDLSQYGIENNIAGYVTIPRMDIELPIYLGATDENLSLGVSSLGYTSVPVGGENSNTVLAAHRGYQGESMFRDIESLEIGDMVYVTNFWETLVYEVSEIRIILPTEIQEVYIQPGKDLLTLVTCHPYTKNYQRYIVFCERTEYKESETKQQAAANLKEMSSSQRLIFIEKWLPRAFFIVGLVFLLIVKRKR